MQQSRFDSILDENYLTHATLAHLYQRTGDRAASRRHYRLSRDLCQNESIWRWLDERGNEQEDE